LRTARERVSIGGRQEGKSLGKMVGRILLVLLVAVTGAAGFHLYYRSLPDTARCRWDHPFDQPAKQACRHAAAANVSGYSPDAARQLDKLIDKVSR
jgi:hypothetical protein